MDFFLNFQNAENSMVNHPTDGKENHRPKPSSEQQNDSPVQRNVIKPLEALLEEASTFDQSSVVAGAQRPLLFSDTALDNASIWKFNSPSAETNTNMNYNTNTNTNTISNPTMR